MKSKMKKLVSLVLAMAMVLTMTIGMSATQVEAADITYTITINNETADHTYYAYQIFAGTLASDGKTLSNITWGSGVSTTAEVDSKTLIQAIQAITDTSVEPSTTPFSSCSTAEDVADVLAGYGNDSVVAEAFADVVAQYLSTTKTESSYVAATTDPVAAAYYKIEGLEAGYYLVKDADSSLADEDDAYTDYILKVVTNVSVDPKSSTPEVDKQVEEINDTTGAAGVWQDEADFDIGDTINYRLIGTLPETLSDYTVYQYIFTDTLSKGLTFTQAAATVADSDVTVTVYTDGDITGTGTVVSTDCYDVTLADVTGLTSSDTYYGGHVLTITIADVNTLTDGSNAISVTSSSKIVVTYSAKLNNDAVIGSDGNPNEVVLTYSNNPNDKTGGETGKTPESKVIVYTFKVTVNKVKNITISTEENGTEVTTESTTELAGAGFTLYKKNSSGGYDQIGDEITGVTTFTFTGLDAGSYKIVETTVPDGFNKADDVTFDIVATYDTSTPPALTNLEVKNQSSGDFTVETTKFTNISTNIVNKSGSVLPSTGGIGTTIFYIVGAILVLGAGVVLVTRRRTRA